MAHPNIDMNRGIALVAHALSEGGERKTQVVSEWAVCGGCSNPYTHSITARPEAAVVRPGKAHPLILDILARCRRCDACRQARAQLWRYRAQNETRAAARTWFSTFTLSQQNQDIALAVARDRIARQGLDYDALAFGEQFVLRHNVIQTEITRYFKRIRKNYCGSLRYLVIAESHKSGAPHYHALLHQVSPDQPLVKSLLEKQWQYGFSSHRLVTDMRRATYVCKYLSKSLAARVRASQGYGTATPSGIVDSVNVKPLPPPQHVRLLEGVRS
jgi:hypothetical protein